MNEAEVLEVLRERLPREADQGMPRSAAAPTQAIRVVADRLRRARRRRSALVAGAGASVAAVAIAAAVIGHAGVRPDSGPSHRPTSGTTGNGVDCTKLISQTTAANGHTRLFTFDSACAPVPLATGGQDDSDPALSPDGHQVAFVRRAGAGTASLVLLDRNSGATTRLAGASGALGSLTFSPDGSQIAYVSRAQGQPSKVWAVAVDGGAPRQITSGSGDDTAPAWSPDGRELAYTTDAGLATIDVASGAVDHLPQQPSGLSDPFWSYPDMGPGLYALRSDPPDRSSRIVALDQQTGRAEGQSPPISGRVSGAISDPFGVHLAYSPGGDSTTIATFDGQWRTLNESHLPASAVSFAAVPAVPQLGHTVDGRTYGSQTGGRHPDLVAAFGTALDGSQVRGYVAAKDIDGRSPSSPEQALRWNHLGPQSTLLYARDGNTIIGLFQGEGAGSAPALTTYVVTPPDTSPGTMTGTVVLEGSCSYLVRGDQRTWLIWPWGTQLRDGATGHGTLADADGNPLVDIGATTQVAGDTVAGQSPVAPCTGTTPPTYVTALNGTPLSH